MSNLEKLFDELQIAPEGIIYILLQRGKIDVNTAIKFHSKELTLEEILKQIKDGKKDGF